MSDLDQVRLLIADLAATISDRLFTNDQIQLFLDMEGGNVKLAAAAALETVAVSEVLVSKKIRTQDLTTDGPAVATALQALAAKYREQAADESDAGVFEVFDFDPYPNGTYS